MNLGGLLRRELAERAQECAREHGLPHCLSYGQSPAVCLEGQDLRHGNFLPVTYRTMLRDPNWRRRLQKAILQDRKSSQNTRMGIWRGNWTPVTSSDAPSMNVFCYPVGYPWLPTAAFPF
jgi:hypothetical protein